MTIEWDYFTAVIIVAAGFLAGLIFEKSVLKWLTGLARRTEWRGDDIIVLALKNLSFWFFGLFGFYLATLTIPLSEPILQMVHRGIPVVLVVLVTLALARISIGFVRLYTEKARDVLPSASILTNLTRAIVYLIGFLIILQALGISITPILTTLGIGGLAVALALQDTLSNFFSGLHIILSRKVNPGDYIKLDSGEEGYVTDTSWRETTIRALPNNLIIIPNTKLAASIITNFHEPEQPMSLLVQVGVSYDSDLEKVERVTIEVGRETMREVEGGMPDFEPFIRYHTFADFSINFTVILMCREFVSQYLVKHEFVKRLFKRYREEGIEIPFPIRTVLHHEMERGHESKGKG